jgi:uncharacterized protein
LTIGGANMTGKYEIYRDKSGKYRWKLTHASGRVAAKSGKSYATKANAIKGIWGTLDIINSR